MGFDWSGSDDRRAAATPSEGVESLSDEATGARSRWERDTKAHHEITDVVIRLAGDSGDGMQLTGSQFTAVSALAGNDLATLPDFPAEIRAPAGTLPGCLGVPGAHLLGGHLHRRRRRRRARGHEPRRAALGAPQAASRRHGDRQRRRLRGA